MDAVHVISRESIYLVFPTSCNICSRNTSSSGLAEWTTSHAFIDYHDYTHSGYRITGGVGVWGERTLAFIYGNLNYVVHNPNTSEPSVPVSAG